MIYLTLVILIVKVYDNVGECYKYKSKENLFNVGCFVWNVFPLRYEQFTKYLSYNNY